ncbi:hypothetical protein CCMA1212_003881 [Trichoderma ghanense]|uniref:Uncharacterized protein n=1 Tax=Trichoderma ghanense TaxID=65468 RepID=A0ABY2HC27_9HYPO
MAGLQSGLESGSTARTTINHVFGVATMGGPCHVVPTKWPLRKSLLMLRSGWERGGKQEPVLQKPCATALLSDLYGLFLAQRLEIVESWCSSFPAMPVTSAVGSPV